MRCELMGSMKYPTLKINRLLIIIRILSYHHIIYSSVEIQNSPLVRARFPCPSRGKGVLDAVGPPEAAAVRPLWGGGGPDRRPPYSPRGKPGPGAGLGAGVFRGLLGPGLALRGGGIQAQPFPGPLRVGG